jgi:transcription elongation factor S-II
MDQRELETRLKALQKAVADKDSTANVISILETLKKEVSPTEELLRVCSCPVMRIPEVIMQSLYYLFKF